MTRDGRALDKVEARARLTIPLHAQPKCDPCAAWPLLWGLHLMWASPPLIRPSTTLDAVFSPPPHPQSYIWSPPRPSPFQKTTRLATLPRPTQDAVPEALPDLDPESYLATSAPTNISSLCPQPPTSLCRKEISYAAHPRTRHTTMETLQLAQMLADLSSLNAAVRPSPLLPSPLPVTTVASPSMTQRRRKKH